MNTFPTKMAAALIFATLIALPACKKKPTPNKPQPTKKEARAQESKKTAPDETAIPLNKRIERLTLDEALRARKYYKAQNKKPQLAQSLERLLVLTTDHALASDLIVELADIRFELEDFAKAEALYHEHTMLYPGNSAIAYIKAREIESAFRQVLLSDRDQTKTKTTYELAQVFLAKFPAITESYDKIATISQECAYLLLENELNHAEFYLLKYAYTQSPRSLKSAEQRLIHIKNSALPKITDQKTTELEKLIETELEKPEEQTLTIELLTPIAEKVRIFITNHQNKDTSTPEKKPAKTTAIKRF
jgi:outer membrane protein assembly factor BamD (BamD/ComL family)